MDGFYRRGDVWWARLAVPARLRQAAGRREFVQSCRTTDKHAGRVVAAALLARWRRQLFELEGGQVDIEKLVGGGPRAPNTAPGWEVGGKALFRGAGCILCKPRWLTQDACL